MRRRFISFVVVLVGSTVFAVGCSQSADPSERDVAPATPPPPAPPPGATQPNQPAAAPSAPAGGSSSTLGKARDAAKSVIAEAERKSQEVADSVDDPQ